MPFYYPVITRNIYEWKQIFHLRSVAWQELDVSVQNYNPNSFEETLDLTAIHWIIKDKNCVVAAARINILRSIDETPYPLAFRDYDFSLVSPIIFYSRLVVHPNWRGLGLSNQLDKVRIDFIEQNRFLLTVATANGWRISKLARLGFSVVGPVNPNAGSSSLPIWRLGKSQVLVKQIYNTNT